MPTRFPLPVHGTSAVISLHFDGSASNDSDLCGCGAQLNITHTDGSTHTHSVSVPLGNCTSNEAEYLGLIFGLRFLQSHLQHYQVRHAYCVLNIQGDSQLVINQLDGTNQVTSSNLKPLHRLATALCKRFLRVSYAHSHRVNNVPADRLANAARKQPLDDTANAVYYPSLSHFLPIEVEGTNTLASHDLGTTGNDPSNWIDMHFLASLPNGMALLVNMNTVTPLSVLCGKTNMTVLGSVMLKMQIRWNTGKSRMAEVEFFVVHRLPVPVHFSFNHPHGPDLPRKAHRQTEYPRHQPETLPRRYAQHEWWTSNIIFIGSMFM